VGHFTGSGWHLLRIATWGRLHKTGNKNVDKFHLLPVLEVCYMPSPLQSIVAPCTTGIEASKARHLAGQKEMRILRSRMHWWWSSLRQNYISFSLVVAHYAFTEVRLLLERFFHKLLNSCDFHKNPHVLTATWWRSLQGQSKLGYQLQYPSSESHLLNSDDNSIFSSFCSSLQDRLLQLLFKLMHNANHWFNTKIPL